MSLETWVRNGWVEKRESSPQEIKDLLSVADRCLDDYKRAKALSAEGRLSLAHSAILAASTVALRAEGYRVKRGGNEHYYTIQALEFTVDPKKSMISEFDVLRKKRNQSLYEVSGRVSEAEADHFGKLAVQLRQVVEKWIWIAHPELLK